MSVGAHALPGKARRYRSTSQLEPWAGASIDNEDCEGQGEGVDGAMDPAAAEVWTAPALANPAPAVGPPGFGGEQDQDQEPGHNQNQDPDQNRQEA